MRRINIARFEVVRRKEERERARRMRKNVVDCSGGGSFARVEREWRINSQ